MRRWMFDPKTSKTHRVLLHEAKSKLSLGWKPGRICDKIWVHHPTSNEELQIRRNRLYLYEFDGWVPGRQKKEPSSE